MSQTLLDRWIWIIAASVTLITVVPLVVIWFIVESPPEFRMIATVLIIVVWGVAAGYKDWVIARRKEQEPA